MLNYSPWLIGRKTAAGMTLRTSRGQSILQKRRSPGTFTPSAATLFQQTVTAAYWPIFRQIKTFVRSQYKALPPGKTGASQTFKGYSDTATAVSSNILTSAQLKALLMAKGSLSITPITVSLVADLSLGTVVWTMPNTPVSVDQSVDDVLEAVVYNINKNTSSGFPTGAGPLRGDAAIRSLPLPAGSQLGDGLVLWTSFTGDAFGVSPGETSDSVGDDGLIVA